MPTDKEGSKPYQLALREALKKRPDYKQVLALLKRALKQGDPYAAYALATWYLHGSRGFKKDIRKGTALLKQAAQGAVASANYDLAVSHENGIGVRKNEKRAFELYLTAALLGDKSAFFETGRCYFYGIGTKQDRRTAKIWLTRAKQLGASRT